MSAAVNSPVTLLPAAFGILVLQKAYGVARASVTPRLLPAEITLVTANARSQLITRDRVHARRAVAAGIQASAGPPGCCGRARLIYLAACSSRCACRNQVDVPPTPTPEAVADPRAAPASAATAAPRSTAARPGPPHIPTTTTQDRAAPHRLRPGDRTASGRSRLQDRAPTRL